MSHTTVTSLTDVVKCYIIQKCDKIDENDMKVKFCHIFGISSDTARSWIFSIKRNFCSYLPIYWASSMMKLVRNNYLSASDIVHQAIMCNNFTYLDMCINENLLDDHPINYVHVSKVTPLLLENYGFPINWLRETNKNDNIRKFMRNKKFTMESDIICGVVVCKLI